MNIMYCDYGFCEIIRIKNHKQKLITSFKFDDDFLSRDECYLDNGTIKNYKSKARTFYEEIKNIKDVNKIKNIYETKYKGD